MENHVVMNPAHTPALAWRVAGDGVSLGPLERGPPTSPSRPRPHP